MYQNIWQIHLQVTNHLNLCFVVLKEISRQRIHVDDQQHTDHNNATFER